MIDQPPLIRAIPAATIPSSGIEIDIEPSAEERTAVVADFDFVELPRLAARLSLRRAGDKVFVEGHLTAFVVQRCVVSLDPVPEEIDTTFERRFVRESGEPVRHVEIDIDATSEDPPDVYAETIDLGALVLEELALAINPYPRAPGVEFAAPDDDAEDDDSGSPFAVLKSFGNRGPT